MHSGCIRSRRELESSSSSSLSLSLPISHKKKKNYDVKMTTTITRSISNASNDDHDNDDDNGMKSMKEYLRNIGSSSSSNNNNKDGRKLERISTMDELTMMMMDDNNGSHPTRRVIQKNGIGGGGGDDGSVDAMVVQVSSFSEGSDNNNNDDDYDYDDDNNNDGDDDGDDEFCDVNIQDPLLMPSFSSSYSTSKNNTKQDMTQPTVASMAVVNEMDVAKYFADREMTPLQERMNGITVIPGAIYCLYFCLSGAWVDSSMVTQQLQQQQHQQLLQQQQQQTYDSFTTTTTSTTNTWYSSIGCFEHDNYQDDDPSSLSFLSFVLPQTLPSLPPIPVLVVALGVILHAPFSFLYHWVYAHAIPSPVKRTEHWSRRMDHSMIHFASLCFTYGTTGSLQYFLVNLLYTVDCIYKHFQKGNIQPKRNQLRLAIAICSYTLPILRRGNIWLFLQTTLVLSSSSWFFIAYPIGGWSHSVFHLIICFLPPLILQAACQLSVSHDAMLFAAQCIAQKQDTMMMMTTMGTGQ